MNICPSLIRITYLLGFLSAVAAVVYRGLLMLGVGADLAAATNVQPRNFLQLSILLLVLCLATDVYARNRATTS